MTVDIDLIKELLKAEYSNIKEEEIDIYDENSKTLYIDDDKYQETNNISAEELMEFYKIKNNEKWKVVINKYNKLSNLCYSSNMSYLEFQDMIKNPFKETKDMDIHFKLNSFITIVKEVLDGYDYNKFINNFEYIRKLKKYNNVTWKCEKLIKVNVYTLNITTKMLINNDISYTLDKDIINCNNWQNYKNNNTLYFNDKINIDIYNKYMQIINEKYETLKLDIQNIKLNNEQKAELIKLLI